MVTYAVCAFVKRVERSYPTINKYLKKQYILTVLLSCRTCYTIKYGVKDCPREREIKRKRRRDKRECDSDWVVTSRQPQEQTDRDGQGKKRRKMQSS